MTAQEIPFCPDPFTFLSRDQGRFLTCCPSWMHESRFIYDEPDNLWEIWNHPTLVEWRELLLRGDYRYCGDCPNRFRRRVRNEPLPDERPVMERPPITYGFQDNATCNLHCPSCRLHSIRDIRRHKYSPWKVLEDFPDIQTMALSLAGDPFANKEHLQFMQEEGPPDLILWTNGILLPHYWNTLKKRVTVIVMSVDACTPETYEHVRQPATWKQLQRALHFIADLARSQVIVIWQLAFVVQGANFREMPGFVDMAQHFGAHIVQFTPIAPWPHIDAVAWQTMNISDPRHPNHSEFQSILRDRRLHQPEVDLGFVGQASLDIYAEMSSGYNIWKRR